MQTITTLKQAADMEAAKAAKGIENKSSAKFTFLSPAFNSLVQGLLTKAGPLDPSAEIKTFKLAVLDRGYDFFTWESLDDWTLKYGGIDEITIRNNADFEAKTFIFSVKNASHPEHQANRLLFAEQFDNNEEKVNRYFYNKKSEEAGRHLRPFKNLSYQEMILKTGTVRTLHQEFERNTFRDLMVAKWSTVGYVYDNEYKARFLAEYCIALT